LSASGVSLRFIGSNDFIGFTGFIPTQKGCWRAEPLWYHDSPVMYRLLFQNQAATAEPVVIDLPSVIIGRLADCHVQLA